MTCQACHDIVIHVMHGPRLRDLGIQTCNPLNGCRSRTYLQLDGLPQRDSSIGIAFAFFAKCEEDATSKGDYRRTDRKEGIVVRGAKEKRVADLENLQTAESLQERFEIGLNAAKAELRRLETEREILEEKIKKQRAIVEERMVEFRAVVVDAIAKWNECP